MKNLDIEKLERQNIYKVPEHFFEEMQMKVLSEATPKKTARILKMNWVYSVAAAAAMIFGISFFVNQNNNDKEFITATYQIAATKKIDLTNSKSNINPEKEAVIAYQTLEKDLTNAVAENQALGKTPKTVVENNKSEKVDQKNSPSSQNSEAQVDQILVGFTAADLADLSKNVEQDVYLDLYN